jgi:glycosyltransferase involved in cell wall biosynthesis
MLDTPAVSIVIPLYNMEHYIGRALNSILAQTIQDFEVIVVDDGSTDQGSKVVRGFSDHRIHLIQQPNQGVSAARNRGINESQSDLIAFLDADDEWLPGFIETILRLKAKFPDAGLYGTGYQVHYPGSIVHKIYAKNKGDRLLSSYFKAVIDFSESGNISYPFNSSSFAAWKDALNSVGGYPLNLKVNEDVVVWGKIALKYHVAYSPTICSTIHRFTSKRLYGTAEYLVSPFPDYISTISSDELLKRDDVDDLRKFCELCILSTASFNIFHGHGARARSELSSVKSPCYRRKKCEILILSYVPLYMINFIYRNMRIFSYVKHKICK